MKMAMKDGQVFLKDISAYDNAIIKSWGLTKYNRTERWIEGPATIELLNKLAGLCKLPEYIEQERQRLNGIQEAVDKERMNEKPVPLYDYPVKATLFAHQVRACNMFFLRLKVGGSFAYFMEMGLGKSITSIATAGELYEMGLIKTVLVVCPSSIISVWVEELNKFADFEVEVVPLTGTKDKRIKALKELRFSKTKALKVAVINYESIRTDLFDYVYDWNPDMVIADESQRIKTHDAAQSKAMHKLGDVTKYKLILSGTPVQNDAIDIYSQYRFLDKTVFGDNFYSFRGRYAIMGGFNKKQIIGYRDLENLIKKEYSVAYRVTKEEALDLPEQTFITRTIPLEGKAKQLYQQLKRDSYAEIESGEITAPTVLVKLLRLQQFTGGFLQADEADKPEWVYDGKLKALEDILDDYVIGEGKKLVVFCRFRAEIGAIENLFLKKKIEFRSIYGDIKPEDRGQFVEDFQTNPEVKVFLAQIDTAGLGITLTAADTCVYYSKNFNYAAYSQSLARIHRIGQRNVCVYIDLCVEGTIDTQISKALDKKEDLAKTVVDSWKRFFK